MSQPEFLSTLFTAAVAFGAVLFGVFGIFYSVYSLYASLPTKQEAQICKDLCKLCRVLSVVGVGVLVPVLVPLWYLTPACGLDETLSGILAAASGALVVATLVIAFRYM